MTDIFDFYLLRQNQDLMQKCKNVIQKCEVNQLLTRLLTVDQKQQRVLMRYVTMDEIWIYNYTPESNR